MNAQTAAETHRYPTTLNKRASVSFSVPVILCFSVSVSLAYFTHLSCKEGTLIKAVRVFANIIKGKLLF